MSGRLIYRKLLDQLGRWFNPGLCLTCGVPIGQADFICCDCRDELPRVVNPCQLCGLPNPADGTICPACRHRPPRWQRMIAPLVYRGSSQRLIQDFKFNERIFTANALLTHLYPSYANQPVEVLLPVPLHRDRLRERGFNQSEEIAMQLSRRLGIALDRRSLHRIRATETQSGLSLPKRRKNILKAFAYEPIEHYRSVAVVDDVITSGSTVTEVCKLLQRSGVKDIQVWALARALKRD